MSSLLRIFRPSVGSGFIILNLPILSSKEETFWRLFWTVFVRFFTSKAVFFRVMFSLSKSWSMFAISESKSSKRIRTMIMIMKLSFKWDYRFSKKVKWLQFGCIYLLLPVFNVTMFRRALPMLNLFNFRSIALFSNFPSTMSKVLFTWFISWPIGKKWDFQYERDYFS